MQRTTSASALNAHQQADDRDQRLETARSAGRSASSMECSLIIQEKLGELVCRHQARAKMPGKKNRM